MNARSAAPAPSVDGPFFDELKQNNLAPLWAVLKGLVPSEPKPAATPFHWTYAQVREFLMRAGDLITAEEAERRVLVLENPGFAGKSRITDALYAGIQLILPGEIAPAHRHTQSALRFVLEGQGGYTTVNGERTSMHPGDFIITPSWAWHDHGHEGTEPVIWLDGLDVPFVSFTNAGFREEHDQKSHALSRPEGDAMARYGNGLLPVRHVRHGHTSPIFNYPYERTRDSLEKLARTNEIDPHLGLCLRYVNPINGDWAIPTLATAMRLVPRNWCGRRYRSTDSTVLVCVEGSMEVVFDTGECFRLSPNDVVAVPGWTWHCLSGGSADAVVFSFSERPVQEKLGLWIEQLA